MAEAGRVRWSRRSASGPLGERWGLCRPTSVTGITATGARSSLWGSPASTPFPAGTPHSCCWHWGRDPRSAQPAGQLARCHPPRLVGPWESWGSDPPPAVRGASSLGLADNGPVFPGLTGLSSEKRLKGVFSVPLRNLCCPSLAHCFWAVLGGCALSQVLTWKSPALCGSALSFPEDGISAPCPPPPASLWAPIFTAAPITAAGGEGRPGPAAIATTASWFVDTDPQGQKAATTAALGSPQSAAWEGGKS